jgi:zinc protease
MRGDIAPWTLRHITKDGILVSVVGDLDAAHAATLVDQLLDGLPEKSIITDTPKMVFKKPGSAPIKLDLATGDQAILVMGTSFAFNSNLEDWTRASMLSTIFAGDQKSRLFKDIRESTGATYGLQPSLNFFDAAMINAVMGRIAKGDVDKTVGLIKSSWDKFRANGPSDDEIANAKATMAHYIGDLSRNHVALAAFIRDYMTGHWTPAQIAKLPSIVNQLDLKVMANRAQLFPENPIIVIAQ